MMSGMRRISRQMAAAALIFSNREAEALKRQPP
jgi:hypothetical protein